MSTPPTTAHDRCSECGSLQQADDLKRCEARDCTMRLCPDCRRDGWLCEGHWVPESDELDEPT